MSVSSVSLPDVPASPTIAAAPISPSRQAQPGGIALPLLMLAAIYAIPIVVALRPVAVPVMEPDIWWHLRVGQWISEHRAVPVTDSFSRYGADKPWLAYSWLYEVLIYRLYEMFGLTGIILYRVVMSLAVAAALHRLIRRREPRFLVAAILTATAVLALAPLFSERPWLFTILFSILTLDVVLDVRAGRASRWTWLLPIIFVLWANLHIQFIYGLLLLALACIAPRLDALLRFPRPSPPTPLPDGERGATLSPLAPSERGAATLSPLSPLGRGAATLSPLSPLGRGVGGEGNERALVRRMLVLSVLCFAATLVNPYHAGLYRVVGEYATQPGAFRCVNELRALEFRDTPDWVVLLLGASAAFALGRRRQVSSFEILLLAGAGALAFHARRDLWLLVAAAAASLTQRRSPLYGKPYPPASCWIGAAALLIVLTGFLVWQRQLFRDNLERKTATVFPVEAAAILAERGYPGPLFNDFNWGGFLIWSLPQYPVVLDGRTNLHGDARILRIGNTWAAGPGWQDDPDLTSAGVVLADRQSPLASVLVLDRRFELVHEDAVARIFVRRRPTTGKLNAGEGTD